MYPQFNRVQNTSNIKNLYACKITVDYSKLMRSNFLLKYRIIFIIESKCKIKLCTCAYPKFSLIYQKPMEI